MTDDRWEIGWSHQVEGRVGALTSSWEGRYKTFVNSTPLTMT